MATIRDVAKLASVSIATVSRVINHDVKFQTSADTRQKVLNAARILGYASDKTASTTTPAVCQRLRIGCILNSVRPKYVDSFYMCLLSGFEAELNRLGGTMIFLKTPDELCRRREEALELYRSVGSVLIMEYLSPDIYTELAANVPYLIGVDIESPTIDTVTHDRLEASMLAMEHLMGNGHRRIAYVGGNERRREDAREGEEDLMGNRRFWGYRCALISHGLPYRAEYVRNSQWDIERCRRQVRELMSLEEPPTAILGASDTMAIAAISACGELGFSVPGDVSVMGISDNEQSRYSNPPLTTVRIPQNELGVLAARLACSPGKMEFPRKIHVPLTLVERSSVRRVGEPPLNFGRLPDFPAASW